MSNALQQRPLTLWEQGRRPGRDVVSLGVALALSAMTVDLLLSEGLGLCFDLAFVTLCVGAALLVRQDDFFDVGVFPPLAMALVVLLLVVSERDAVARADDGFVQAVIAGLSGHAIALGIGYAACLALLATRHAFLARH